MATVTELRPTEEDINVFIRDQIERRFPWITVKHVDMPQGVGQDRGRYVTICFGIYEITGILFDHAEGPNKFAWEAVKEVVAHETMGSC